MRIFLPTFAAALVAACHQGQSQQLALEGSMSYDRVSSDRDLVFRIKNMSNSAACLNSIGTDDRFLQVSVSSVDGKYVRTWSGREVPDFRNKSSYTAVPWYVIPSKSLIEIPYALNEYDMQPGKTYVAHADLQAFPCGALENSRHVDPSLLRFYTTFVYAGNKIAVAEYPFKAEDRENSNE